MLGGHRKNKEVLKTTAISQPSLFPWTKFPLSFTRQTQVGQGFEQPGLVEGVLAHGRGLGNG